MVKGKKISNENRKSNETFITKEIVKIKEKKKEIIQWITELNIKVIDYSKLKDKMLKLGYLFDPSMLNDNECLVIFFFEIPDLTIHEIFFENLYNDENSECRPNRVYSYCIIHKNITKRNSNLINTKKFTISKFFEKTDNECIICFENPKSARNCVCSTSFCHNCAAKLEECPVCKIKWFLSHPCVKITNENKHTIEFKEDLK